jgi:hypothetical protein
VAEPTFVNAQQAAAILGISRSQLQNLHPYLPHLYAKAAQHRMFVRIYLVEFNQWLKGKGKKATVSTARGFAKTEIAKLHCKSSKLGTNKKLREKPTFLRSDVMDILGISSMTVTHWQQRNMLVVIQERLPGQRGGKPHNLITSSSLRAALEWCSLTE